MAHVDRLKPYHQRNKPEVIPEEQEVTMEGCIDNEDIYVRPPPPIPPQAPPPQPPVPPTSTNQVKQKIIQPQLIQPQLFPRRSPRFSNVSALQKAPKLKILTGEGVQKVEVQKMLVSQSEHKVSWAAVITETHRFHPAQEGFQLDCPSSTVADLTSRTRRSKSSTARALYWSHSPTTTTSRTSHSKDTTDPAAHLPWSSSTAATSTRSLRWSHCTDHTTCVARFPGHNSSKILFRD